MNQMLVKRVVPILVVMHVLMLHLNLLYKVVTAPTPIPSPNITGEVIYLEPFVEREKAPVLKMNDIERVRKEVEEEEKLGEDEDSPAEEGLADVVGSLDEFDIVLGEHERLLASAKEKLAVVEKLSQDIIDKRIALETVKRGKIMNQDSRVTWLNVVEKIGSIEKLSDSKDLLEELSKDFEMLKQSCGGDNGDSCDNFEFSYHDLKAVESKMKDKSHWVGTCAEFEENNRMSSVPDGPTESDLFNFSSAIMDQLAIREGHLIGKDDELPLHPTSLSTLRKVFDEEIVQAQMKITDKLIEKRQRIDTILKEANAAKSSEECVGDVSIMAKKSLDEYYHEATKYDLLSPFLGTRLNLELSSSIYGTSLVPKSMASLINFEFVEQTGKYLDKIVDIIGGRHSTIDRVIDYFAGDYGDGSDGGSLRIALVEYLKNMPVNPKLLKFYRKASFLLGVPNSDARSPGPVFCIGSLEESLKGSLAFDFKEGHSARLDSVSIKSIKSNDGEDVIPEYVQILGLPEKSSDSYNEGTDHTPILLGKFIENEFKSGKWLSLSGEVNDTRPSGGGGAIDHSCTFDTRPALQSVIFEFSITDDGSLDNTNICVDGIKLTGDLTSTDEGPTCKG